MLTVFMYHRVGKKGPLSNDKRLFRRHLKFLSDNFCLVLPGEKLKRKKNVLLTFDDATDDFYKEVFPLLKEFRVKVLLGVIFGNVGKDGFCSWDEIIEMSNSGLVEVASHSWSHTNLTKDYLNLKKEILFSKKEIQNKINKTVDSFIYPYGKCDSTVYQFVKKHYKYSFRIGNAYNDSWSTLLCRVGSDNLNDVKEKFTMFNKFKFYFKYILNKVFKRPFKLV